MTSAIRGSLKENPKFENYVPQEIVTLLNDLKSEHGFETVNQYNAWFYKNKSNIPQSSVRRWTKAYVSGAAHQDTPSWHVRYKEDASIVPDRFSDIKNGRYNAMIEELKKQGEVRYANVSCMHRPEGDGALLNVMLRIVKDFQPNVFPYFSDSLDSDAFSMHRPNPATFRSVAIDAPKKNKYQEFIDLITETDDMVSSVLPKDCFKVNVWGNHENRILRYLLDKALQTNDLDILDYILDTVFSTMQSRNVLWVESDRRQFIPLSRYFWVGHGDRGRSIPYGTARAYLEQVKNEVSLAVGHTHRQELVWVRKPYSEVFCAVAGTLGTLQPAYAKQAFRGHNWGFQLITHPYGKEQGSTVEEVRINYQNGFYITHWRGKEYSEKANIEYHELLDCV